MQALCTGFEDRFVVEAHRQGELLWREEFDNLVVEAGLNDAIDKYFKGNNYTAAHYVGLTDGTPTVVDGDTMASHAGWTEVTAYAEATRQTLTLGAVASKSASNTANKAVFTVNADNTVIGGAFIATVNTKGGATGVLYGAGAFSADRTLMENDTLTVTVTVIAAAA